MLKKHPNRRLYDTGRKSYVVLDVARPQLLSGETVVDFESGEDVTAEVLLSLVRADHQAGKGPTAAQLKQFIQEYSDAGE